jgi:hypothetical protein
MLSRAPSRAPLGLNEHLREGHVRTVQSRLLGGPLEVDGASAQPEDAKGAEQSEPASRGEQIGVVEVRVNEWHSQARWPQNLASESAKRMCRRKFEELGSVGEPEPHRPTGLEEWLVGREVVRTKGQSRAVDIAVVCENLGNRRSHVPPASTEEARMETLRPKQLNLLLDSRRSHLGTDRRASMLSPAEMRVVAERSICRRGTGAVCPHSHILTSRCIWRTKQCADREAPRPTSLKAGKDVPDRVVERTLDMAGDYRAGLPGCRDRHP